MLFDGFCNLCGRLVDFLLRKDRKKRLQFVPQQSELASEILKNVAGDTDAVFFLHSGRLYSKSSAAIRVIYELGGLWKAFIVLIAVPPVIRNFFYDLISHRRFLWFGKRDSCYVPGNEYKDRFPGKSL